MMIARRILTALAATALGVCLIGGPAQADTSWGGIPVISKR